MATNPRANSQTQLNAVPPRLPDAPAQYDQRHLDQLNNVLRLYFNQIQNFNSALADGGPPFNYIDFSTTNGALSHQTGRLDWNSLDATLELDMEYGVIQQIGQETYARVQNSTGTDIPNGTVVGFAGATDNALLVAPYLADGSASSLYILGVMTHDLPDSGQKGYCTTWGFVRDVDTSAFSVGDLLYASPSVAGAFTNVKPTAPNNVIPVAACIISDATEGVIFVRPTVTQQQYYGKFSKTDSQTAAVINTAYPVTLTTTDVSNGVVIGSPTSRLVVPDSGLYQFNATLQVTSSNSSSKNIRAWLRKNGTDVTNSARLATSAINNGYLTVSIMQAVSLDASDYIELVFSVTDTALSLSSVASTAYAPAAPAVLVQITQVQQ